MNSSKFIWAVGDIHGMKTALSVLLSHIENKYHSSNKIFLGDYIDRGGDSKGVIDLISQGDRYIKLIGNHEQVLLDLYLKKKNKHDGLKIFYNNGGQKTLDSFGFKNYQEFEDKISKKYIDFLLSLKYSYIVNIDELKIVFIHGGLIPGIPIDDQLSVFDTDTYHSFIKRFSLRYDETFLWIRKEFFNANFEDWKNILIIHGHTPVENLRKWYANPPHINYKAFLNFTKPYFFEYAKFSDDLPFFRLKKHFASSSIISINLDTGCANGNRLTAIGLDTSSKKKKSIQGIVVQVDIKNNNAIIENKVTISL